MCVRKFLILPFELVDRCEEKERSRGSGLYLPADGRGRTLRFLIFLFLVLHTHHRDDVSLFLDNLVSSSRSHIRKLQDRVLGRPSLLLTYFQPFAILCASLRPHMSGHHSLFGVLFCWNFDAIVREEKKHGEKSGDL
jgi:hypothetical protein